MAAKPTDRASAAEGAAAASREIDAKIGELGGWRATTLARVRQLIHDAQPAVVEEVKWRKPTNPAGVPVWSHAGILCTGETYREKVKLTFPRGAALADPTDLFNAGLAGGARRAIDLFEGAELDEAAFKALIQAASALNQTGP